MSKVPPDFMAAGCTARRDGCTSQLSNMASNFSHWRASSGSANALAVGAGLGNALYANREQ
jgi:hypothetical protein